jgi:hypothetical protein
LDIRARPSRVKALRPTSLPSKISDQTPVVTLRATMSSFSTVPTPGTAAESMNDIQTSDWATQTLAVSSRSCPGQG